MKRHGGRDRRIPAIAFVMLAVVLAGSPLAAQDDPSLALRPFVVVAGQAFAARETFEAGFGQSVQPFFGGGLSVVSGGFFVDLGASRFRKTGERVFRNDGQTFRLGLPLTVTITPLEFSFGYKFRHARAVAPYVGAGLGSYRYQETSPEADPAEQIDTRNAGYLAVAGVDLRASRWFRVGVDLQYTRVRGILGEGGFSRQVGEDDLGGVAARLKFTVGR